MKICGFTVQVCKHKNKLHMKRFERKKYKNFVFDSLHARLFLARVVDGDWVAAGTKASKRKRIEEGLGNGRQ